MFPKQCHNSIALPSQTYLSTHRCLIRIVRSCFKVTDRDGCFAECGSFKSVILLISFHSSVNLNNIFKMVFAKTETIRDDSKMYSLPVNSQYLQTVSLPTKHKNVPHVLLPSRFDSITAGNVFRKTQL